MRLILVTTAILLGLLATQAISFSERDGGTTDWGWTGFGLSLAAALGVGVFHGRGGRKRRGRGGRFHCDLTGER